jgi:protein-tyrosine kinase
MPQLIERAIGQMEQRMQARGGSADAQTPQTRRPPPAEPLDREAANAPRFEEATARAAPAQPPTFQIPHAKLRRRGFISPTECGSTLSEEIRIVKRQLMKSMAFDRWDRAQPGGRIVMITSARAGEGKSFVALNLALSFAMDEGIAALLIDAGNNRSTAAELLGVPREPGLIEALVEPRAPLAALVRKSEGSSFAFLPPGRMVPSATALFGGEGMTELLQDALRLEPAGVIVVDAPPLLFATEAMELAQRAGQVLVVVEAEATSDAALRSALDLLAPCANVSLVLNKGPRFTAARFGTPRPAAG